MQIQCSRATYNLYILEWLYRCSTILFFSARSMLNHQTIEIYSMKYIFNRFHINIWKQLNIHSVTLLFACKTIDKYWINILFWNFKHCNTVLICSNICSLLFQFISILNTIQYFHVLCVILHLTFTCVDCIYRYNLLEVRISSNLLFQIY